MDSIISFVIGLLTTTLSLFGFAQLHPGLPQVSNGQAPEMVGQETTQATKALTSNSSSTPTSESANWKAYVATSPYDVEFKYPSDFSVGVTNGLSGKDFQASIVNFNPQYSYPYIKPLSAGQFHMQIWDRPKDNSLSLASWLASALQEGYNSPERVQVIGEYKNTSGTLVSQEKLTLNGHEAIQRTVSYPSNTGPITVLYTYLNTGTTVFQFIGHINTDASMMNIHQQIVASFKVNAVASSHAKTPDNQIITSVPSPSISSISPSTATVGVTVTIQGSGFSYSTDKDGFGLEPTRDAVRVMMSRNVMKWSYDTPVRVASVPVGNGTSDTFLTFTVPSRVCSASERGCADDESDPYWVNILPGPYVVYLVNPHTGAESNRASIIVQ